MRCFSKNGCARTDPGRIGALLPCPMQDENNLTVLFNSWMLPKVCRYFDSGWVECTFRRGRDASSAKPRRRYSSREACARLEPGRTCRALPAPSHVHRLRRTRRAQYLHPKCRTYCECSQYARVDADPRGGRKQRDAVSTSGCVMTLGSIRDRSVSMTN